MKMVDMLGNASSYILIRPVRHLRPAAVHACDGRGRCSAPGEGREVHGVPLSPSRRYVDGTSKSKTSCTSASKLSLCWMELQNPGHHGVVEKNNARILSRKFFLSREFWCMGGAGNPNDIFKQIFISSKIWVRRDRKSVV